MRADEHERAVPVGEAAHDACAGGSPCSTASIMFEFVRMRSAVPGPELVQQVGRRLADALPQVVGGGPQPPRPHLRGDLFGFVQRGSRLLCGEYRLQGGGRPFLWIGGTFESTLRMKCTMQRWYFAFGQHRADRPPVRRTGRRPRAWTPLQAASSIMPLKNCSAGRVLLMFPP